MENSVELIIPEKIDTIKDKKTEVSSFFLPFKFLDGTPAAVTITKLKKGNWTPNKDIKSIKIYFNED